MVSSKNTVAHNSLPANTEITEDITVYRYSQERTLKYLRSKVLRLSEPKTLEISRSIIRDLAKDGLMEDGNEELLKGSYILLFEGILSSHHSAGQLKAACDLVGHYLSPDTRALLYASFESVKVNCHAWVNAYDS